MKKLDYGLLAIGFLLVSLSFWQIQLAFRGIEIIRLSPGNLPVTVFLSRGIDQGERSTILVGHGFAGSSVIMHGFALTLAHAGYNVVAWDFDGHGANPNSLGSSMQRDALVQNAEQALEEAVRQRLVSGERVAILGHSMGSGVALAYGQLHPETAATIAVSPVPGEVSPNLPRNLLLMAGTQEPSFLDTARRLLAQAGGENSDFDQGLARRLIAIPQANHLSILFSGTAQKSALEWVNAVFGEQPEAVPYIDRRILLVLSGSVRHVGRCCRAGRHNTKGFALHSPATPGLDPLSCHDNRRFSSYPNFMAAKQHRPGFNRCVRTESWRLPDGLVRHRRGNRSVRAPSLAC
jgi:pimeloyl-ACP methyl ester carboxylesterase